jgi:mRNA interferase RelE/StbE
VPYTIIYLEIVVKKDIPDLPKTMKVLIKKAIETRLTIDPLSYGNPLRYSLKGSRRLRVGDYRIIYTLDTKKMTVLITAIKHRKIIYDD